ncbi:hypothetical protein HPB48_022334 [Haemaphysalis longicornis]|uniref:HTH CENPB-type domain-containing protein n=1 Tax=Haemaphysalis longicornis TaxID=44386 RepID=A0A9J6H6J9_HAELO|nr:hypothetical protein HPB48_022334 [Haemaphysalis longicornis]
MQKQILKDARQGMKVVSLVEKYELSQSTISTISKSGGSVMKKAGTSGHNNERKWAREPFCNDFEEALYQWFLSAPSKNLPISGPLLAARARKFAFLLRNADFLLGGGRIQRFKECHGIIFKTVTGEAASLGIAAKEKWLDETLPDVITCFEKKEIYNAEETALFYHHF